MLDHAAEIGGDPTRVAVGGDSAGGNLSAIVAQHFGARLAAQLLIYPAVDMTASFPSIEENAEGLFLTKQHMDWFQGHYIDGSGLDVKDPILSPLYASDDVLAATAPAFVLTAEYDPLRDEGEAYAAKLEVARRADRAPPLRRHDPRLLRDEGGHADRRPGHRRQRRVPPRRLRLSGRRRPPGAVQRVVRCTYWSKWGIANSTHPYRGA